MCSISFDHSFLCLIHCVVLVIGCSRSQAINYGSASELYFSQHDVMRDLALYLASRGSIVGRKKLLMPKKEDSKNFNKFSYFDRP